MTTLTFLNYQELDTLLAVLESSDWHYLTELTETDIPDLYDKLSQMRNEI
jgi:DNA-binding IclR family transcriptional regulator